MVSPTVELTGRRDPKGLAAAVYAHVAPAMSHRAPPKRRRAKSQAVAVMAIGARGKLRHHSATTNEYCPSSSTVARHFGIRYRRQKAPFLRLTASVKRPSCQRVIEPSPSFAT